MNYFDDRHLHSIDQRGRLQLPRDVRTGHKIKKGDPLYLFVNRNEPMFLEIRTKAQWESWKRQVMELDSSADKREIYRLIQLSTAEVSADGQGRIVVPQKARTDCGFDSEVVVVNMSTYVEVWSKDAIAQKRSDMLRAFNEINDQLF
jgi:MraZ protein